MTEIEDHTPQVAFKEIVRIVALKPTTELDIILNQVKYRYFNLFPLLYGIIMGINKFLSRAIIGGVTHFTAYSMGSMFGSIVTTVLYTIIFFYIYSWIVVFISNLLKGIANVHMTYGVISYSLIPMIIGALVFLLWNLCIISSDSITLFIKPMYLFIAYSYYIFLAWSLFILIIGNAFINSFSMLRSFISSAALIIILVIAGYFVNK